MSKRFYPAVFTEDIEGGYSVSFPDLPGCFTEGDSLEQAYEMSLEAIGLYLENQTEYPKASSPKSIKTTENEFVVLIEFDLREYLKNHSSELIKKTLTIPRWVNTAGEKNNLNFSSTLTEAIIQKLEL